MTWIWAWFKGHGGAPPSSYDLPFVIGRVYDPAHPPAPYDGSQRRRRYWKKVTER